MVQIGAELLRSLSDTAVLPIADSIVHLPRFLDKAVYDLKAGQYGKVFVDHRIDFGLYSM